MGLTADNINRDHIKRLFLYFNFKAVEIYFVKLILPNPSLAHISGCNNWINKKNSQFVVCITTMKKI